MTASFKWKVTGLNKIKCNERFSQSDCRGATRNFVREGPVTDVVRFQTLAILHKDHFDVNGQLQQDMTSNIFYQSASINFNKDKKTFAFAVIIIKQLLNKQFSMYGSGFIETN